MQKVRDSIIDMRMKLKLPPSTDSGLSPAQRHTIWAELTQARFARYMLVVAQAVSEGQVAFITNQDMLFALQVVCRGQ